MPTITRNLPVVDVAVGAIAPAASGSGAITAILPLAGIGTAAAPAAVVRATGTATRTLPVAGTRAKAKPPLAIVDPDFLSALIRYWESDAALEAAGLGTLYFDVVPPGPAPPYPYVVVSQNASTSGGFSTLKLTWRDTYLRFGIYGSDMDQVVNLGAIVARRLDRIVVAPLSMWDGQQTLFRQESDTLAKIRPAGPGGIPFVWCRSYLYHCRISRTRV